MVCERFKKGIINTGIVVNMDSSYKPMDCESPKAPQKQECSTRSRMGCMVCFSTAAWFLFFSLWLVCRLDKTNTTLSSSPNGAITYELYPPLPEAISTTHNPLLYQLRKAGQQEAVKARWALLTCMDNLTVLPKATKNIEYRPDSPLPNNFSKLDL